MVNRSTRLLTLVVAAVALISLGGAVLLALGRSRAEDRERRARAEAADRGPKVTVVRVEAPPGVRTVVLPGDVRAFWQTTLYAKVNGYVQDLAVDRGAQVRTGQVLARIASPETDHQVAQARSTLRVRQQFAARVHALAPTHAVSAEFAEVLRRGYRAGDSPASRALIEGGRFIQIADCTEIDHPVFRSAAELSGIRTVLFVPLAEMTHS